MTIVDYRGVHTSKMHYNYISTTAINVKKIILRNHVEMMFFNVKFFSLGAVGTLWFVFWLLLGFSSPASHPRISAAERKYIESSIEEDSVIHASNDKVIITLACVPTVLYYI